MASWRAVTAGIVPEAWRLADTLSTVLLAPRCATCAAPLERPAAGAVCPACWAAVRVLSPPLCDTCGGPLASDLTPCCPRCLESPPLVTRLRAVGPYEGRLREILHALKYQGRRSLARPLAALMRVHGGVILADADVLVPVPLHWQRRWARGFNQAAEIAVPLGRPVLHALRRTRPTRAQVSLTAAERRQNVRGAFALRRCHGRQDPRSTLGGLSVVLVDDVTTTGATLEACAAVLVAAGVRRVSAITAARAAPPLPRSRPTPPS